jgi:hypothetical protein
MVAEPVGENNPKATPAMRATISSVYWQMRKLTHKFALLALVFAIIGNLASIPAHIDSVRIFLIRRFEIEDAVFWHVLFGSLISIVLVGSYLFLAFWLYKRNIAEKKQRVRHFYGTLILVGAVAVSAINIYIVWPRVPPIEPVVENIEGKMTEKILAQQINETGNDDNGGFQFAQNGGPHDAQVWTTAQILYGLEMRNPVKPEAREAIRSAFAYIERMRVPAINGPCQVNGQLDGWGYQKSFPWGVTEINSWVLLAKIASLRTTAAPAIWGESEIGGQLEGIKGDLAALARRQHNNGGWAPIAKTDDDTHLRTYSTVMALWALIEAKHSVALNPILGHQYDREITDGAEWLITHWQSPDDKHVGGWRPNPSWTEKDAFPGLTAQAIYVLELVRRYYKLPDEEKFDTAKANFIRTSIGEIDPGNSLRARDVADNSRPHDSDRYLANQPYTVEQSTFLWYPWAIAALTELKTDDSIEEDKQATQEEKQAAREDRQTAAELFTSTLRSVSDYWKFTEREPVIYSKAEGLLALEISNMRNN